MLLHPRTLKYATIAGTLIWSVTAHAGSDPTGVWLDHNGRGAVEISPCADGNGLCGYVVHVKNSANTDRCGLQILGNVTPGGGGWIYSPERGRKYPVALKRLSDSNLRVVGNAGSFFSRTFTWKQAPSDIARCGETVAATPETPAEPETTSAASDASPTSSEATGATEDTASSTPEVLQGASSGSVALLAQPRPRIAETEPPPPAPVEATPAAKPEPVEAPVQPAAATSNDAPETDTFDAEPERMCKFRIPYVGRVIDIPCRD